MTREEEINKVAKEYVNGYQNAIIRFKAFRDGAKYADNHPVKKHKIWHSTNEVPQKGGQKCLVKELNGDIDFYIARPNYPPNSPYFENGRYLIKMDEVDKWAYLDDILNL